MFPLQPVELLEIRHIGRSICVFPCNIGTVLNVPKNILTCGVLHVVPDRMELDFSLFLFISSGYPVQPAR